MEQDSKVRLEITGPAHLVEIATKDLPPKYVRDRIMLVKETEQDATTGVTTERWYIDAFDKLDELPPGEDK